MFLTHKYFFNTSAMKHDLLFNQKRFAQLVFKLHFAPTCAKSLLCAYLCVCDCIQYSYLTIIYDANNRLHLHTGLWMFTNVWMKISQNAGLDVVDRYKRAARSPDITSAHGWNWIIGWMLSESSNNDPGSRMWKPA